MKINHHPYTYDTNVLIDAWSWHTSKERNMEIHYWHLLASPLSEDVTLCGFNVGANMYTYMPTTYVIIFQDYCPSVVAIYQYFLFFCNEGGTNRGLVSAGSCFPYTDLVFIQFPCVGRMRLKFCFNVEWPYAEIQTNDKIYLLSLCLWIHKAFLVCAMKNVPTQGWNPQNEVFFLIVYLLFTRKHGDRI